MDIISKNYDGVDCVLVDEISGKALQQNQQVTDFRGEVSILTGGRAPHKPSSQGKVYVQSQESDFAREFYASVFNAKWVPKEEFLQGSCQLNIGTTNAEKSA